MVTMGCLREEFLRLPKKDQDILSRYFGVYGFPKADLQEIAMWNLLKESAVEKAKDQVLKHLRDRSRDSFAWELRRSRQMVAQFQRSCLSDCCCDRISIIDWLIAKAKVTFSG